MFITPQSVQAETAYRQERIKREFRRTRRERPAQATKPEPRHACHPLRTTTAG